MSIGTRLVELRNQRGLTRVQLAEELHIPMTTLRNYETDAREPGHKFLIETSKYFNVSVDYILENEKAPASEEAEAKSSISMEQSNRLYDALVASGLIIDDDLAAEDIQFLGHVVDLVLDWFSRKHKE